MSSIPIPSKNLQRSESFTSTAQPNAARRGAIHEPPVDYVADRQPTPLRRTASAPLLGLEPPSKSTEQEESPCCIFTTEPIQNPVKLYNSNGKLIDPGTYESSAIIAWLSKSHITPLSGAKTDGVIVRPVLRQSGLPHPSKDPVMWQKSREKQVAVRREPLPVAHATSSSSPARSGAVWGFATTAITLGVFEAVAAAVTGGEFFWHRDNHIFGAGFSAIIGVLVGGGAFVGAKALTPRTRVPRLPV